jgi:quercetin dioxygenase-like cupin family protein
MPRLIGSPVSIPVPGGKQIDEYVGRVATSTASVSVAHMRAPAGWSEPPQAPDFEEITLVLKGSLRIEYDDGVLEVAAGQAVVTAAGERVRYLVDDDEGAEYVAICLPAFAPELAHREDN